MDKNIEVFVKSQFPRFYDEEGPMFIAFVEAYYEWMSGEDGVVGQARSLLEYRDVDTTLEQYIEHFRSKYLFGMPNTTLADKKFLIKHILDVYRAKGSTRGYKLLFRLLYNEDIQMYLPSDDILRASDGQWSRPKFLEITDNPNNASLRGKFVKGVVSNAVAAVEEYTVTPVKSKSIHVLHLSNVSGVFVPGDPIVVLDNDINSAAIDAAPRVVGSLSDVIISEGGQLFNIGDRLEITDGSGYGGLVRVSDVDLNGSGTILFSIISGGEYISKDASIIFTRDGPGSGANFRIDQLTDLHDVVYNTDLIIDHHTGTIEPVANQVLSTIFNYSSKRFGTIASLTDITTGSGYTSLLTTRARDTIKSNIQPGIVTVSTGSKTVTGINTSFLDLVVGDIVYLSTAGDSSSDYRFVTSVANNTSMTVDDFPNFSSSSARYQLASTTIRANFDWRSDPPGFSANGSINGENDFILASPVSGTGIIRSVEIVDTGIGYKAGDRVGLRSYKTLANIEVVEGGTGYANNDVIVFNGGFPTTKAKAVVQATNANGTIQTLAITGYGSGYQGVPTLSVKTRNGTGAVLQAEVGGTVSPYNLSGTAVIAGPGVHRGEWTSTRGLLNSDKYLQDSYYYQEYSYEIQSALPFEKYADIMKLIYHSTGSELFGRIVRTDSLSCTTGIESQPIEIS